MENATLKPYADYKPSGIDWLGDVPAHWEVRRLKQNVYRVQRSMALTWLQLITKILVSASC